MREFDEQTGWERARSEALFTVSVLEASGVHEKLLRAMKQHLDRWAQVETARRTADDGIVRSNARVAWADHGLDEALRAFANDLLRDVDGDKAHRTFAAFFPEAPGELLRLGLENELQACARLLGVAGKVTLSKSTAAKLTAVKAAVAAGKDALEQRRNAYLMQGQASLDVAGWKEATNHARVSVHVQLQAWALEHNMDRSYADRFFPARSAGGGRNRKGDLRAAGTASPKEETPRG
jgi:hypothetical protein